MLLCRRIYTVMPPFCSAGIHPSGIKVHEGLMNPYDSTIVLQADAHAKVEAAVGRLEVLVAPSSAQVVSLGSCSLQPTLALALVFQQEHSSSKRHVQ